LADHHIGITHAGDGCSRLITDFDREQAIEAVAEKRRREERKVELRKEAEREQAERDKELDAAVARGERSSRARVRLSARRYTT
jgi:hypothetical protein